MTTVISTIIIAASLLFGSPDSKSASASAQPNQGSIITGDVSGM